MNFSLRAREIVKKKIVKMIYWVENLVFCSSKANLCEKCVAKSGISRKVSEIYQLKISKMKNSECESEVWL